MPYVKIKISMMKKLNLNLVSRLWMRTIILVQVNLVVKEVFFFNLYLLIIILSATIDVKRNICFLDVSHAGNQLAIVENMGDIDNVQESVVRLYDIGRRRDEEDEVVCSEFSLVIIDIFN